MVVIVSLIAVGISAYLSFTYGEEILKQKTADQLLSESTIRGNSIRSLFDTRIKQTQILATDPMIQIIVNELNQQPIDSEYTSKANENRRDFLIELQAFQEFVGFSIGFEDVKIIGKNGMAYFSLSKLENGNFFQDPRFILGMTKPFVDFAPAGNDKKMIVVTPIFAKDSNNSEPIGVIIASMRTKALDDILLNRSGLGKTGEVYLVNGDYVMISESRFIKNVVFNQKVDALPVGKCFEEGVEVLDSYYDYRNDKIFGSSYCAKDLGFVLLAEIDQSEIFAPVILLQDRIFLTGLVLTLGMGVLAFFLSKSISRPLVKLQNAANEIAKGNFDIRTNIKTSDEVGQLSLSFDTMAKNLQDSILAIKQREEIIKQQQDILLQFSDYSENFCVCIVDVVGSTKLTATLTDSESSKFYGIFINSMAAIVRNFQGIVVKNIGDALLFYFPKTNTKDPNTIKNVLDCCIKISESHDEINKKMKQENLPTCDYKISVTYGPVRVAKVATSSIDDIFGSTVNRCSKLNIVAPLNGVVIGEELHDMVKSFNTYAFAKISDTSTQNEYGFVGYAVAKSSMIH